jgi:hypothetical protein
MLPAYYYTTIGIAFAYDPDGYWVELIQRGMQN